MTDKPRPQPQQWDAAQYRDNAAFVPSLGRDVLALLAARAGEYILDLGCGDGVLTAELAAGGCRVLGVDASEAMVAAARQRGLDVRQADGHELAFSAEFDAVFSNAALHWMTQPAAVLAGVFRALKPGGRLVAEMGGLGNVATALQALDTAAAARGFAVDSPWYFPSPDEYRRLLQAAGFRVVRLEHFPRPTPLPGRIHVWLETFAKSWIQALPATERAGFVDEVAGALQPLLCDQAGRWQLDYVRLRFAACKPG